MPCGGLRFAVRTLTREAVVIGVNAMKSFVVLAYRLGLLQYLFLDRNLGAPVRLPRTDGVIPRPDPRHEEQVAGAAV